VKKNVWSDCAKAIALPVVFHSVCIVVTGIVGMLVADKIGEIIDIIFRKETTLDMTLFIQLVLFVLLSVIIAPVLNVIDDYYMLRNALMHDRFVTRSWLQKKEMEYDSETIYILEDMPNTMRINCVYVSSCIIVFITYGLFLLITSFRLNGMLVGIVLGFNLIQVLIPISVTKKRDILATDANAFWTEQRGLEWNLIKSGLFITQCGILDVYMNQLKTRWESFSSKTYKEKVRLECGLTFFQDNLEKIMYMFLFIIGAVCVAKKEVTPGQLAEFLFYVGLINKLFGEMVDALKCIPELRTSSSYVEQFYTGHEEESGEEIDSINDISIRKLEFAYDDKKVLKKFDNSIRRGEKIVLVGENGSGKSTFFKILDGLIEKNGGDIRINATNADEICVASMRKRIAYLFQTPFLFNCDVKENITLGQCTNEEKMAELLKGFAIDYLLKRDDIGSFSGGEKQKISLCRAFLREADVLLLDEPSNYLDDEAEKFLEELIINSTKTVIIATHDQRLMNCVDRCISMG